MRCVGKFENCSVETLVPVVLVETSTAAPELAVTSTVSVAPAGRSVTERDETLVRFTSTSACSNRAKPLAASTVIM